MREAEHASEAISAEQANDLWGEKNERICELARKWPNFASTYGLILGCSEPKCDDGSARSGRRRRPAEAEEQEAEETGEGICSRQPFYKGRRTNAKRPAPAYILFSRLHLHVFDGGRPGQYFRVIIFNFDYLAITKKSIVRFYHVIL